MMISHNHGSVDIPVRQSAVVTSSRSEDSDTLPANKCVGHNRGNSPRTKTNDQRLGGSEDKQHPRFWSGRLLNARRHYIRGVLASSGNIAN